MNISTITMNEYNCPIKMLVVDMTSELSKFIEDAMFCEIKQTIGFDVDKDELIKALKYDRNQYEEGYQAGKRDSMKFASWEPIEFGTSFKCSNCSCEVEWQTSQYCPDCGAYMKNGSVIHNG